MVSHNSVGVCTLAFKYLVFMVLLAVVSIGRADAIDERYNQVCVCNDPYSDGRSVPVIVRDFKVSHHDFEWFTGETANRDIVTEDLGADGRPVYSNRDWRSTTNKKNFDQWYRDVPGVNQRFAINLPLEEVSPGIWGYENFEFFPIDNLGWGNQGFPHNFHFTLEMHMKFIYQGGETFTFVGDDDLWVYINGKLAINLGGTHPMLKESVNLDEVAEYLGIEKGQTYNFDLFFAERKYDHSGFKFETSIDLECL